jgi:hypothetical protein
MHRKVCSNIILTVDMINWQWIKTLDVVNKHNYFPTNCIMMGNSWKYTINTQVLHKAIQLFYYYNSCMWQYPSSGCSTDSISDWTSLISVFSCYKNNTNMLRYITS